MSESGSGEPASLAEDAYADYLARREHEPDLTFEAFCGEHGAIESELRRVHARWSDLSAVRGHLAKVP